MVIEAFMAFLLTLDPRRRRAAEVAPLGQLCGTGIHHATPRPILPVAIAMVCSALFTPLVKVPSTAQSFPPGGPRTAFRAVLAASSIAALAGHEVVVAPPALELAPSQHQSSCRKLGAAL
jgi:hypothetical protein